MAAFRKFKSLSRDNYEGSSQAGSSRHGKKQVVSWLHLGARKTFSFGSFDTSNLITSPGAAKVTKSGPKGLPARIWAKTAVSAHFHTSSLIAGPEPRKSQNRVPKGVKSLSLGNYEGSTQAGSWRHGEKQFVCWLHLGGSNPYHGTIMKNPHKLDPDQMERFVSWLHLGSSNPYHGTIMKDPHKLNPDQMERSNSCLGCI